MHCLEDDAMYGFAIQVELGFEQTMKRVVDALTSEGFGVLSDTDVQATLTSKLGDSQRPYHILGACNPSPARQLAGMEPDIRFLLPCNVVVRENAEGQTRVAFMVADNPQVKKVAADVRARLDRVVASIA
jgi:uncharacterized protein (DUF302 family)